MERTKGRSGSVGTSKPDLPNIPQPEADAARAQLENRTFVPSTNKLPRSVLPNPELITVLDQGTEGVSVGVAVAAVLNYQRAARGESRLVSIRMLYEFARIYDEWPGSDYEGSSLAGAVTGLWLHGVCLEVDWPFDIVAPQPDKLWSRGKENRPAAVMRVERNIEHLRAAVFEHSVVAVAGTTHDGWHNPLGGRISYPDKAPASLGGHAWAVGKRSPDQIEI